MAAQGAHVIWYDERSHHLELPWNVRLLVSFVPPISALATLHLLVKMAEDLIGTIRLLVAHDAPVVAPVRLWPNGTRRLSVPTGRIDGRVLRIVRANPRTIWRVVKDRTGLSEANAKRVLTAALKEAARRVRGGPGAGGARPECWPPKREDQLTAQPRQARSWKAGILPARRRS